MTDKNVVVTVYALRIFITIIVIEFAIQLDLLILFNYTVNGTRKR